ncbi:hypothetical protein CLOM_g2596 [Closterium sp. NIES-68]|nr:hypothetical protein CLOM_g2596 [Closterium sp. NIES-68]GJP81064.1 hypothetical protein CLOP_g11244 [Closterium sp. NIES-67]
MACRRSAPLLLSLLSLLSLHRLAHAATSPQPTRFEQAMAETLTMSADRKAQLHARVLRDAMLDDLSLGDDSGDEAWRRRLKGGMKGRDVGLTPPALNSGPSMADVNGTLFRYASVTPKASVDWRQTMYISPIQRQFECASCWAIAAVDSIAMMWAITTKTEPVVLSPQQVCDCATKQCCGGGWADWAFSYVLFNGGIQAEEDYAYVAQDSTVCNLNASAPTAAKITGWELVPPYSAVSLMKAVSMQPVVAFLSGSERDFQSYSSRGKLRIYGSPELPGLCSTDINHVVVVVGYNYTGAGKAGSYWILKNSWFSTWGDAGYMYLAMSPDVRGKCGLHALPAMYPVYYPFGPQPVRFSGKQRDDSDGRWWTKPFVASSDACQALINPCGAGECYTKNGAARCDCSGPENMVEVVGVPTSKCAPKFPCNATALNPCGAGTCSNTGTGAYTCQCPAGYAIGAEADGSLTCVGVAGANASSLTYTSVPGDTCAGIAAAYNTTTAILVALNPFLNCSQIYIPPGFALSLSNSSAPATPVCTASYLVRANDTCVGLIAALFSGSEAAFRQANPLLCTADRPALLPSQQVCAAAAPLSAANATVLQCGQTYVAVVGDSCSATAIKYNLTLATFTQLNPALDCSKDAVDAGNYLCVAPKSDKTVVNCTAWYTVLQGDNCPNIWNAANLTEATFLAINPGIRCQAPYLQVGQKVCTNSPSLAALVAATNTSFSLYTVKSGDTLAYISSRFVNRCTPNSVSPAAIAAYNNILETAVLLVNATLIIPCNVRIGAIDCGCATSLPVCGSDYVTYPSYCDAVCNYATPIFQNDVCTGCNAACMGRAGAAPAAGFGCTQAICPYPTWPPPDSDCSLWLGDSEGKCCGYVKTTCENVCTDFKVAMGGTSTQQATNYKTCYNACTCCKRIPCGFNCTAPSSCWNENPRRCSYSIATGHLWQCVNWPAATPLP